MKKIIYIVLLLVLVSGCGKIKEKAKKDDLPIKYQSISYNFESINDNKTRVYAVIKNTSQNNGKIYNIGYAVRTKDDILQQGDVLNKSYKINSNEELLIIFDVDYDINNISSVIVTPFDKNNKPIEYYNSKNTEEKNNISNIIDTVSLNKNILITFSKNENIKLNKMKLVIYSSSDKPLCIAYNYASKIEQKKEYKFKCGKIDMTDIKVSLYYE